MNREQDNRTEQSQYNWRIRPTIGEPCLVESTNGFKNGKPIQYDSFPFVSIWGLLFGTATFVVLFIFGFFLAGLFNQLFIYHHSHLSGNPSGPNYLRKYVLQVIIFLIPMLSAIGAGYSVSHIAKNNLLRHCSILYAVILVHFIFFNALIWPWGIQVWFFQFVAIYFSTLFGGGIFVIVADYKNHNSPNQSLLIREYLD